MSTNTDNLLDLTQEEMEDFGFGLELEEVFSPAGGAPKDILEPLTAGREKLLTATQAVACLQQPSEQGSARASSTSSWYDQVMEEEKEAVSQEGDQVGPWTQGLHHPSGESSQDLPMDGVELGPGQPEPCLLYTSPSPRDGLLSRMPSSA